MAPTEADITALTTYFEACGLNPTRSNETARSKLAPAVETFFRANAFETKQLSDLHGKLMVQIVKDGAKLSEEKKSYAAGRVLDGSLDKSEQVAAAIKYLATTELPVDKAAFDAACGVGFTYSPDSLLSNVRTFITSRQAELSKTGWSGVGKTLGMTRTDEWLKWCEGTQVKEAVDKVYEEIFGTKEAAMAKAKKEKEEAAAAKDAKNNSAQKAAAASASAEPESEPSMFATGWLSRLHKPGQNAQKDPKRMEEHLKRTGGKVFTRFPPEPNGFLHIGHSKAITVNFGYAAYNHGHCYLRFDDTNPEAEEQIYFDKILECVRWLGFEPYKVTYSSDNFGKLYELAKELIKIGKAYTSNDTAEEIQNQRGGKNHGPRYHSKDRNKPVSQVLEEFEAMRAGKYKPGEMTLRMKQDMESGNPTMWDIIAYRVLEKEHMRTGKEWCIYPTYDFTHCLCDSFEDISHSLCTTEFIAARTAYEWLCDELDVYRPRQSEYGRLNIEGAVMSKRKLLRLVKEGHVSGWDDPRIYTLVALRRRGVPPAALISFVSSLGVSTQTSTIPLARFEQTVRQHLEKTTPRLMLVLHPVKVTIENLPSDFYLEVAKPIHPKDPSMGTNKIPFTREIYIERDDFRETPSKEFFRLAPGATVGLLNVPHPITYVAHSTSPDGELSIVAKYDDTPSAPKPKSWIHWVAEHKPSNSPVKVKETRVFKRLFRSDDPASLGDAYIDDIDPSSLTIVKESLIEVGVFKVIKDSLETAKKVVEERKKEAEKNGIEAPPQVDGVEVVRFQGTRVAYFALDLDSSLVEGKEEIVLNTIANLKEDSGKKA